MSPPNRESVPEFTWDDGIAVQTLYSWRSQWQKQGLLVPATSRPPEQWSPAVKLATVIKSAGLSGVELGSFCRERGLNPKQFLCWGIALAAHGFTQVGRKGSLRIVPHQFSERPVLLPLHGDGCVEHAEHRSGGA
jgi:transposase-like protein